MLNEHLNLIYISEDINNILGLIKSKSKNIADAASNGNILKLNNIFDKMPDISSNELKSITARKIDKDYKESEKYLNSKIKKAPEEIKNIIILAHSTLNNMKKQTNDEETISKVDETIKAFDLIISKVAASSLSQGISLILVASILSMFIGSTPLIVTFIAAGGSRSIIAAVYLYTVSLLLKIFIEAKKAGQKVIN